MEEFKKSDAAVMDEWKNYLGKNGNAADIFEIIERAIMVAASDHPMEFRIKREKIAQTLFSINCSDHVEEENINIGCKESKKMSDDLNVNNNHHWDTINYSNINHEEAEMEVLRIKEVLDQRYESESVLDVYESLLKLQQMGLSFKTLKVTKIGRSVNGFQKHGSRDVRLIARRLIKMWKGVVDEWMKATEKMSSVVQEEEEKKEESITKKQMVSMGMKKESTSSGSNVVKIKIIKRNSDYNYSEEKSYKSIEKKLEASKRKLHQRYEEVENAKRQRKIQVVELHQLKKQGLILPKTINHNRKSLKMGLGGS